MTVRRNIARAERGTPVRSRLYAGLFMALAAVAMGGQAQAQQVAATPQHYSIAAGSLGDALNQLATQSGLQIVYSPDLVQGKTVPAVSGQLTWRAALEKLLAGSGLEWAQVNGSTVAIRSARAAFTPAPKAASSQTSASPEEDKITTMPDILVTGHRTLNADIERTRDDIQPYVVFSAEDIQKAHVDNLDDFLRSRLPMNAEANSPGPQRNITDPVNSVHGNQSQVNLRGLGVNQTLVLVDGRRLPSISDIGINGNTGQPDINGIPIAAVERIEVLPSTASGIYGGGATGGVINIVLKRDYSGAEIQMEYGSSFRGDAAHKRFDFTGGMNFNHGRTHLMMAASHQEADPLLIKDRDFFQRSRALILQNNPDGVYSNPYGLPYGYTPNIHSLNNSNLVLKDGTTLNSSYTYIPIGYPGVSSDNGTALVANAGSYNLSLPDDLRGARQSLIGNPTVDSYSFSLRQDITDSLQGFLDYAVYNNRYHASSASLPTYYTLSASAPNNPFTTPVNVTLPIPGIANDVYNQSKTSRGTLGLIARLSDEWSAEVDQSWSTSTNKNIATSPALTLQGTRALAAGTLDAMRDVNSYPVDYSEFLAPSPNSISGPFDTQLKDTSLRVGGPLFSLPAGAVSLTGLIEHRSEEIKRGFMDRFNRLSGTMESVYSPARSQEVDSYYAEFNIPVVGESNGRPGIRGLDLQASVRQDRYKTRSVPLPYSSPIIVPSRTAPLPDVVSSTSKVASTDYTFGFKYTPFRGITLRASTGTGFLPPSLAQIAPYVYSYVGPYLTNDVNYAYITDPLRGDTPVGIDALGNPLSVDYLMNGNPSLKPEESKSWSAGVIINPSALPGLRVSIDYTRIKKAGEIGFLYNYQQYVDDESIGHAVRGENLPGDLPGWAGPITQLSVGPVNFAKSQYASYDFQLDYTWDTERWGQFKAYGVATWTRQAAKQGQPTSPMLDAVGYTSGPLEWRGNAGFDWSKGALSLGWNTQYYDSYYIYQISTSLPARSSIIANQGHEGRISSEVYHDLYARYGFGHDAWGILADSEIAIGIQNVFDKVPATLASLNAARYSGYGDPRLRRYTVTFRKSF